MSAAPATLPPSGPDAPAAPAAGGGCHATLLAVFALTLFLNAALLFVVQPMFSKMALPLLGGAPAVWNTSMLVFQTLLLGGYLAARDRAGLMKVMADWRVSSLAGLAGALASMGWFTAYAMRSAVDVRIVGLVEVIYSYAVSRRLFREPVTRLELWGMVLVVLGIVLVSVGR